MHEGKLRAGRYLPIDLPSSSGWEKSKVNTVKRELHAVPERKPVALLMELNYVQNLTDNPLMQNEAKEILEMLRARHGKLALITDASTEPAENQLREFWGDPASVTSIKEPLTDISTEMDNVFAGPGIGEAGPGTTGK
jgi:hypothetical protein